uniref:WD_REPEATS_REGION domain-containing protein n=1 Tax=Macrostomum lignano TaxID=282301 RepID=A0A1I8JK43_9PLAT
MVFLKARPGFVSCHDSFAFATRRYLKKSWSTGRYLVSPPLRPPKSANPSGCDSAISAFACNSSVAVTGTGEGLLCVWHCRRAQLMALRLMDDPICSICIGSAGSGSSGGSCFVYIGCDNGIAYEMELTGAASCDKAASEWNLQQLTVRRCFRCCSEFDSEGGLEVQLLCFVRCEDFLQLSGSEPSPDASLLQSNMLIAYTSSGSLSSWRLDTGARIGACLSAGQSAGGGD